MLVSAILVGIIATLSGWWFCSIFTRTLLCPLWSGFLVGLAMGNPLLGMQAGANIQIIYLGWITAGGTMPSNTMIAGVFGTALTIISGANATMAPTFAIPFSLLGVLTWQVYMTLNTIWIHKADKYLEEGNLRGVALMNYLPSGLLSIFLNGLPAFLLVYLGGEFVKEALGAIPTYIVNAFGVIGALMPALGIAMLLNYLGGKKFVPFFFLGFFLTEYLKLNVMSLTIFGAIIAAIMYYSSAVKNQQNLNSYNHLIETEGGNLEQEYKLRKSDLVKHWFLGLSSECCYNYERLQALGTATAMIPIVKRLYKTREDQAKALKKYMLFFNTEPHMMGTVIHGVAASMEEAAANGDDISDEDINAFRTGAMGPLAGIGDSISQGMIYPTIAGLGCSLALDGNFWGPIMFQMLFLSTLFIPGYKMYMLGYKQGKTAVLKLLKAGMQNNVTQIFSIIGLMVIGSMAAKRVNIMTNLTFSIGNGIISIQKIIDLLIPGLLPLLATLTIWKMTNKNININYIIVIIFVIGTIASFLGILSVAQ